MLALVTVEFATANNLTWVVFASSEYVINLTLENIVPNSVENTLDEFTTPVISVITIWSVFELFLALTVYLADLKSDIAKLSTTLEEEPSPGNA